MCLRFFILIDWSWSRACSWAVSVCLPLKVTERLYIFLFSWSNLKNPMSGVGLIFCGLTARAVRLIFSNAWFSYAAKLPEPSLPPGIMFRQMRRYTTQNNRRLKLPVIQCLLVGCIRVILQAALHLRRSSEAGRERTRERAGKVLAPYPLACRSRATWELARRLRFYGSLSSLVCINQC